MTQRVKHTLHHHCMVLLDLFLESSTITLIHLDLPQVLLLMDLLLVPHLVFLHPTVYPLVFHHHHTAYLLLEGYPFPMQPRLQLPLLSTCPHKLLPHISVIPSLSPLGQSMKCP